MDFLFDKVTGELFENLQRGSLVTAVTQALSTLSFMATSTAEVIFNCSVFSSPMD